MNGGTPLTPSARISALNIVGDLLRKVGVSTFNRQIMITSQSAIFKCLATLSSLFDGRCHMNAEFSFATYLPYVTALEFLSL